MIMLSPTATVPLQMSPEPKNGMYGWGVYRKTLFLRVYEPIFAVQYVWHVMIGIEITDFNICLYIRASKAQWLLYHIHLHSLEHCFAAKLSYVYIGTYIFAIIKFLGNHGEQEIVNSTFAVHICWKPETKFI